MAEGAFQAEVISDLEYLFPGCVVLKNDPNYTQGFPDLLVLYKNKWAALECKMKVRAKRQPNQGYYIEQLDRMSFARFIYPENAKEVFDELQQAFGIRGTSRFSKSK